MAWSLLFSADRWRTAKTSSGFRSGDQGGRYSVFLSKRELHKVQTPYLLNHRLALTQLTTSDIVPHHAGPSIYQCLEPEWLSFWSSNYLTWSFLAKARAQWVSGWLFISFSTHGRFSLFLWSHTCCFQLMKGRFSKAKKKRWELRLRSSSQYLTRMLS